MKKDFSNTPVSEIAKMAYALACENAKQEVNNINESEVRTKNWECRTTYDMIGIPIYMEANFICQPTYKFLDEEICYYLRIEYRGTTTEQCSIFRAYKNALYYELQKILGRDCVLIVL